MLLILKFSLNKVCQDFYEKWENWSFRIKYIESCVKYCRSTSAPNLVCRRIPISNLSPPREILSFRGSILVAWHHHHDQCMTQEKVAFTITCQIFTLFIFFPRLHKFCNLAILDGRTWSKFGELGKNGKHQPDDLKHSLCDCKSI